MGARSGGGGGFTMVFKNTTNGRLLKKTSWAKTEAGAHKTMKKMSDKMPNHIIKYLQTPKKK